MMDVDFAPTGREFVAGSYDRSVRIFAYNGGHSREVYTAKRMQRVFAARFTGDATYVVTGSDDFNLRIWKVHAPPVLCTLPPCCARCATQRVVTGQSAFMPYYSTAARREALSGASPGRCDSLCCSCAPATGAALHASLAGFDVMRDSSYLTVLPDVGSRGSA